MAQVTIEDLADQLTEVSDKFVASFEETMETEDELFTFLRGRERWYIGKTTVQEQQRTYNVTPTESEAPVAAPEEPEILRGTHSLHGTIPDPNAFKMPKMPDFGKIAASFKKGFGKAKSVAKNIGKKIRKGAAAITKPTKALIGEAGPEIVVPMQKLGDAINSIYKKGSKTMLEATTGFLNSLPSTPSKGKVLSQINKLKNLFGLGTLKVKGGSFGLPNPIEWWNKGRNDRIPDEDKASWKDLMEDDLAQRGQSDESFEKGEAPPLLGRPDQAFNPFRPADKGGPGSGPTPAVRQAVERPIKGLMNFGKGLAGSLGAQVYKVKDNRAKRSKPIPTPLGTGKDMFGQTITMNPPTESAWKKVSAAAAADGVNLPSSVTSAFRSVQEQQDLLDNADDPNVITPAPQGMSPHQQGWAVDIDQNSEANHWMREHGHKHGFHWEGPSDPVHFDFINNEPRDKYVQPDKDQWLPKEGDKGGATTTGGKLVSVIGDFLKKKFKKGDPKDLQSSTTTNTIAPNVSPEQQTVMNAPVSQSGKDKPVAFGVPMVIPGPTVVIPGPPQVSKLDPQVMRHHIVDPFGKGTRVEVAYV